MLPSRRVLLALSIWLSGMTACLAAEANAVATERSAWSTLADGSPMLWGCILVAAILTAALLAQLIFVLQKRRVDPPELIGALERANLSGNYQEAWETCNRWRQTALARILQPALERLGQGRGPVEARLAEERLGEHRHLTMLLWCLLGGAAAVVFLCLAAIACEMHGVSSAAMSPQGPRVRTLALGNVAILAAFAFAFAMPVMLAWLRLRGRAAVLLQAAEAEGLQLIANLPYEEIEGVRIGRDFNAGTILGESGGPHSNRLQVSKELTTLCPSCNSPINSSRNSCPHCGQLLSWS
jgi:hypothetical protein